MKANNLKITELNENKPAADLAPGDFIFVAGSCGKDNNFADWYDTRKSMEKDDRITPALCKIMVVIDVDDNFDLLNNWMSRPAPDHRGGSESLDVPEDKIYNLTPEECETFYNLVTVYRNTRGQWIAVDCQGYDYWRYVYLSSSYKVLFESEIIDAEITIMWDEARRAFEQETELTAHAAAFAARCDELRRLYPELKEGANDSRGVGANIRKFFKKHLPGVDLKVKAKTNYCYDGVNVSLQIPANTPQEIKDQIRHLCNLWFELLPVGEIYNNDNGGTFDAYESPMQKLFGKLFCHISVDYIY